MKGKIIPHNYINASEQPGQYDADQCGRQAVTAQWLYEHPDVFAFIYREENNDMCLDPWLVITGVDKNVGNEDIWLDYNSRGEMLVGPDYQVFVSKKDAAAHDGEWKLRARPEFVERRPVIQADIESSVELPAQGKRIVLVTDVVDFLAKVGYNEAASAVKRKFTE